MVFGVWCSKLNGVTYATAELEEQFEKNATAQKTIRIPLYITENLLRSQLNIEVRCYIPCLYLVIKNPLKIKKTLILHAS